MKTTTQRGDGILQLASARPNRIAAAVALAVGASLPTLASAATYNWNGFTAGTKQWNAANWTSTTSIPSTSDPAAIINFDPALATPSATNISGAFVSNNDLTGVQLNILNLAGRSNSNNSTWAPSLTGNALTFTNANAQINNTTQYFSSNGRINYSVANALILSSTNLTVTHSGANTNAMTFSGGLTGGGNLVVNINSAGNVTFSTASLNNAGTITNGGNSTGSLAINGGVGANVTSLVQNSTTSAMTIGTTALTVNATGTTLTNTAGTKLLTVSGGTTGAGHLILDNDSATDGGVTLSGTSVNHTGSITNSGSGDGSAIISAVIGTNVNAGVVQDSASSLLTLSGANTFTSGLTVKRGTVSGTTSTTAFGAATGTINLGFAGNSDAATLLGDTRTFAQTIDLASGHLGTLTIGNSGSTTTVFSSNITMDHDLTLVGAGTGSVRLSGNLTGSSALRLNSASTGTAALSGVNSGYNGTVTLDAGTLSAQTTTALGTGTLIINGGLLSSSAALVNAGNNPVNINNSFTFSSTAGNDYNLGTGNVTVASSPVTITATAANLTLGGAISGGAGGLVKDGAGSVTLSGTNTLAGNMTVNAGTLALTKAASLNSSTFTVASGATLAINVGGAGEFTSADIDTLKANGGFAAGSMLGIDTTSGNLTYGNAINGSLGIHKRGTNTLILSGSNGYTGPTTTTGGTLQIGDGTTNGSLAAASAITNNATLQFSRSDTVAIGNAISGAGSIVLNSGGTYSFTGANTFSGPVSIYGGSTLKVTSQLPSTSIVLGGVGAIPNGTIRLAPANLDLNGNDYTATGLYVASNSATANQITVDTGKKLTVNGLVRIGYSDSSGGTVKATFTGGGALEVNNASGNADFTYYGSSSASNPNGTVDLGGLGSSSVTAVSFNFGASTQGTTNSLTLAGGANEMNVTNFYIAGGNSNSKGNGTVGFGSNGSLKIRGLTGGSSRATLVRLAQGPGTGGTISGTLNANGHSLDILANTLSLGVTGASGQTGSSVGTINFDTGTIDVTTLTMGAKTTTGTGSAKGVLNMSGGTLSVGTGGVQLGVQATAGTGIGELNLTGGTASIDGDITESGTATSKVLIDGVSLDMLGHNIGGAAAIDTLTFAKGTLKNVGQINNGASGLTKTTTETLTLEGTNLYTAATTVNDGKLIVNGTIANSNVLVNAGTLAGNGTTGNVTLASTGTLAPGNSIDSLSTGDLDLGSGTLAAEINTNTLAADLVEVTGNLSLTNPTLTLTDLGANATVAPDQVFTLINYTGTWNGGLFTYNASSLTDGSTFAFGANQYRIDYDDGNAVTLTVVPEPATLTLLAMGGLGLLRRRRA